MRYNLLFIAVILMHNALFSADLFSVFNTQETPLATHIKKLPIEIQKRIYFMALDNLKKYKQETIKAYVKGSLKISDYKQGWNDIHHYFAFKNYGSECTHIIAFYPKPHMALYLGAKSTTWCNVSIGSFAIAFMHTLENNGKIQTMDCVETQIQAPYNYNGIQLSEKKPAKVYWLKKNGDAICTIKKQDNCTMM